MSRLPDGLSAARPAPPGTERGRPSGRRKLGTAVAVLGLTVAMATNTGSIAQALGFAPLAAVGVPPAVAGSTQFDITGLIQTMTLNAAPIKAGVSPDHRGGTVVVNGHTVVIPDETVVILPANALTWAELWSHAPSAQKTAGVTGMALTDPVAARLPGSYEVHLVGNRVNSGGTDRYIAGLVNISQQDLNQGTGYINFIDYGTGTLEVGGTPGTAGTGARVQINDPANQSALDQAGTAGSGRYGRAMTPDDRFQVDQDNPTIEAETGFPMCIPRVAPSANPAVETDPQCPQANRPVVSTPVADTSGITPQPNTLVAGENYRLFRMDTPAQVDSGVGCLRTPCADPRKQAPFEIGDYVTFAGTLENDAVGQYVSAHTINASLGIYTTPGVDPAYISNEVGLIGTGGLTVFGAGEAAVRSRFEGMTTDESRKIRIYGVDINPVTGATSDRLWGTVMPDLGPPTGAVRGRWRFRPPCTGTPATVSTKICTPPPSGQFIPPTREWRAVIDGLQQFTVDAADKDTLTANAASQVPSGSTVCTFAGSHATNSPCTTANGLFFGQYHAPIEEYIFPENVPGTAIPENNFNTIPFLAYGGYATVTGIQVGVLNPWPSNVAPSPVVCATPVINGPFTVANGGTVQLSGGVTAGATTPVTLQWTAGTTAGGVNLNGALTGATTTTPTFNATGVNGTVFLTLTANNVCGTATASSTIVITQAPPPTINPIQNQTVTAGATVTIAASSSSLPTPTWVWTNTGRPVNAVVPNVVQTPAAGTAGANSSIQFVTDATHPGTYTFTVQATNVNGSSALVAVNVTTTASVPTNITLTPLEYRTSKQRFIITATSTDPTLTSMTLLPYQTETGTTFDPATLGANLTVSLVTPGSFTLTLVGAPPPACNLGGVYATPCAQKPITVKGVRNGVVVGTSAPTALDRIRQ
jgi:hypothetical protein